MKKQFIALILAAAIALPQILGTGQVAYASQASETSVEEETGTEKIEKKDLSMRELSTTASGTCGANVQWDLYDGILRISGSGEMKDYSHGAGGPWLFYRNEITDIYIDNGVTRIGKYAFINSSNLTSVTLPSSLSSIGRMAFSDCTNVKSIDIPEGVTEIGPGAFAGCTGLTSITIPDSVTTISYSVFVDCSNLKDITILNKSCEIWESENTISSTAKIYGYPDSTAQAYARKYDRKFVSLKGSAVKVTKVSVSGLSHEIAVGKKVALKAAISPSNASNKAVTWKSSNTKYAAVNSKGVVTMKKAGAGKTVTITATAKDGSKKKATYKIKCMKGVVKKIKLSASKSVKIGKKVTVKAKVTASKGANKALSYSVSNKKYASVNKKGVVTAKKAGKGKTITVTAKAIDGSGKKATVKIKIK